MLISELDQAFNQASEDGLWMHKLMVELFPICRGLTGPGNEKTLSILSEYIPLSTIKVPSGTKIFSWTVPDEWHPKSAKITDPSGKIYANFSENNLHLVNGSQPIDKIITKHELLKNIYSLPEQPDLIPYVTSYYHPHWGFCMADSEKNELPDGKYKIKIEAEHVKGNLIYGEKLLPGKNNKEIVISTYICHPSMANDNLSGIVVAAALYKTLSSLTDLEYSYRFLFLPETIGSLCWLSKNESILDNINAGIVLSCIGDDGDFTYKRSRRNNTLIDRISASFMGENDTVSDFFPTSGSDERQYCSPGYNLPFGLLSRTYPGEWPYYHTSGDTPDKILPETLGESLEKVVKIILGYELNSMIFERSEPKGEPMLSKYNLYHQQNLRRNTEIDPDKAFRDRMMWLLNLADGTNNLIDIAEKSSEDIIEIAKIGEQLVKAGLLKLKVVKN